MAGPATASGLRSVAVAGDVTNSIIVTGDGVTVQLRVDGDDALLAAARPPVRTPRPRPVHDVPPPDPAQVDRAQEVAALLALTTGERPIELSGPADVGKTLVVLRALATPAGGDLPDGAVYVRGRGLAARDVLQQVLDALVACEPPAVLDEQGLRRELRHARALVVVDGHTLPRDDARALRQALPGCLVVLVARERALGEGGHVPVGGLAEADALLLAEQELGRPLAGPERAAAARACAALDGHPFAVRQAAAQVREAAGSWHEIGGPRPLSELVLEALDADEALLVRQLAAARGELLGVEHVVALLGRAGTAERLEALRRRRVIASGSPRFRVAGVLAAMPAEERDTLALARRLTGWAREHRGVPAALEHDLPVVQALVETAPPAEALALARAADAGLAWAGRWGAWEHLLQRARGLARAAGDEPAEAWALHQLGTRAAALGDVAGGVALLREALARRERLGDPAAEATRHNLDFLLGGGGGEGPPDDGPRRAGPRTLAAVGGALLAGLLAAVVALGGDGPPTPRSTTPPPPVRTAPPTDTGTAQATDTADRIETTDTTTDTTPVPEDVTLTLLVMGGGEVQVGRRTCRTTCVIEVAAGAPLSLVAAPLQGHRFAGWLGVCDDQPETCEVALEASGEATARFEAVPAEPAEPVDGPATTQAPVTQEGPVVAPPPTTVPEIR